MTNLEPNIGPESESLSRSRWTLTRHVAAEHGMDEETTRAVLRALWLAGRLERRVSESGLERWRLAPDTRRPSRRAKRGNR